MRTQKSSSSGLLIFLLLLITFPFWIVLFGVVFGTVGGIIGGIFGIVFGTLGAVLGAIMKVVTLPFRIVFGHGVWFPHVSGWMIVLLIVAIALVVRGRSSKP